MVSFIARMQDRIIQMILLAYYENFVSVLSTLVGRTIQVATKAVADLVEIELDRQNQEVWQV